MSPLQIIFFAFTLLLSSVSIANDTIPRSTVSTADNSAAISNEFEFARLIYRGGFEWPRWSADWPDAEHHFNQGLNRLTTINAADEGVTISLTDDALFDHPWLYVVEVGYMSLSLNEIDNLREYLLRGGFLVVDDFHGKYEWQVFRDVMREVFPNRRFTKLDVNADLYNIHFEIDELMQVPGIRSIMNNRTWEKGGVNPAWYAIHDDHQRIMVVINYNQDLGDAWEHADDAVYPQPYTGLAYRMGTNYVIYAMTH